MIDDKKLQQFLGKMLVDLGGAISLPLARIGVRLGLYKAMDGSGPMTSVEFADKANISERYAREWLAQNAASGYLSYDLAADDLSCRQNKQWYSQTRKVHSSLVADLMLLRLCIRRNR